MNEIAHHRVKAVTGSVGERVGVCMSQWYGCVCVCVCAFPVLGSPATPCWMCGPPSNVGGLGQAAFVWCPDDFLAPLSAGLRHRYAISIPDRYTAGQYTLYGASVQRGEEGRKWREEEEEEGWAVLSKSGYLMMCTPRKCLTPVSLQWFCWYKWWCRCGWVWLGRFILKSTMISLVLLIFGGVDRLFVLHRSTTCFISSSP